MSHGCVVGNPNPKVVESHLAWWNQVPEGTAFFKTATNVPDKSRIPESDCPAREGFFLEGLSLIKMAKALSILPSMNVKLV